MFQIVQSIVLVATEMVVKYFNKFKDVFLTSLSRAGGPLVSKDLENNFGPYYIMGILSYGEKTCGLTSRPGVYTKVADFLEWIVNNIRA